MTEPADVVVRYTYGDCMQLAQAIHELTDWPVVAWLDDEGDGHAFNRAPGGFVDVTGYRSLTSIEGQYGAGHLVELVDAYELEDDYDWPDPTPDAFTYEVARRVVEGLRMPDAA